jgi:hypothetical protein
MTVDRSDRMADAVLRDMFPPATGQAAIFISKYVWTAGPSVKQQVVRLGMILAALQFAGGVCCAQSGTGDEFFPRGSLFPCAAYSTGADDLLRYRASGFNLLGPRYGEHNKTMLQKAKARGLRAIYTVGAALVHDYPSNPADSLKKLHFVLGPWGSLVVKTTLPK